MADKERITLLLQQFADGIINRTDYDELVSYLQLAGNDEEIFVAMDSIWKDMQAEVWHTDRELDQIYQQLIHKQELGSVPTPAIPAQPTKTIRLWYRIAAAAVVVVALSAIIYLNHNPYAVPASQRFASQDLAPGGNRAVLTLANGQEINLTTAGTGKLATQAGVSVTKTSAGRLLYTVTGASGKPSARASSGNQGSNTISTPRGGQYQVNLPDGTVVWLNAASSLTFPVQFEGTERKVALKGEAYFEVAKIKTANLHNGHALPVRMPFIVETASQRVTVLGTHFMIDAYRANTKTTLLEGAVRVSALPGKNNPNPATADLTPGEQADLLANGFRVSKADTEEAMAWKNGVFSFSGQDLESIMEEVERWYDVDVVFDDNSLRKQNFRGSISRFKNISQLLEVLESTGSVHFKMEGRRITAMK